MGNSDIEKIYHGVIDHVDGEIFEARILGDGQEAYVMLQTKYVPSEDRKYIQIGSYFTMKIKNNSMVIEISKDTYDFDEIQLSLKNINEIYRDIIFD